MAAMSVAYDTLKEKVLKWTLTTADATGDAYRKPDNFQVKSVQVVGTFGSGTVNLKGSNEPSSPTNFSSLVATGPTADAILKLEKDALWFRPDISGSTAATVTVYLFLGR